MNNTDKEKYAFMRERIYTFREGNLELPILIGELMFLRDKIEEMDLDWEEKFTSEIATLSSLSTYPDYSSKPKLYQLLEDTLAKMDALLSHVNNTQSLG